MVGQKLEGGIRDNVVLSLEEAIKEYPIQFTLDCIKHNDELKWDRREVHSTPLSNVHPSLDTFPRINKLRHIIVLLSPSRSLGQRFLKENGVCRYDMGSRGCKSGSTCRFTHLSLIHGAERENRLLGLLQKWTEGALPPHLRRERQILNSIRQRQIMCFSY